MDKSLPFEIGQLAEAKSFTTGYRGAWFRCKIQGITRRKGQIVCSLEYYDYPDEKGDTQNNKKATQGCSVELDESPTSQTSANSSPLPSRSNHPEDLLIQREDVPMKERQQMQSVDIAVNLGNYAMERPRADDSLSRTNVRDVLGEVPGVILSEELYHDDEFSKEMRVNETTSINSPPCDSIEASRGVGRGCEQGQMAETNPEIWNFFKLPWTNMEISRTYGF